MCSAGWQPLVAPRTPPAALEALTFHVKPGGGGGVGGGVGPRGGASKPRCASCTRPMLHPSACCCMFLRRPSETKG
jgi:hypothetical protein